MMQKYSTDFKSWSAAVVAERLGLTPVKGGFSPCPACRAERRGSRDNRGPVGLTGDQMGWRCHRCGSGGSGVDLCAVAMFGERLSSGDPRWGELVQKLESLNPGGRDFTQARRASKSIRDTAIPIRKWPPKHVVKELWEAAAPVSAVKSVADWLGVERRVEVDQVESEDLARAITSKTPTPDFARFGKRGWAAQGYSLMVPLFDTKGELRSVKARCVTKQKREGLPKSLSPTGFSVAGLVMADAGMLRLLRSLGESPIQDLRLIIAEGEVDFLTWAQFTANRPNTVVLGIGAGSWSFALASRIPDKSVVFVRTHNDKAGDRYAEQIVADLSQRCGLYRLVTKERNNG